MKSRQGLYVTVFVFVRVCVCACVHLPRVLFELLLLLPGG